MRPTRSVSSVFGQRISLCNLFANVQASTVDATVRTRRDATIGVALSLGTVSETHFMRIRELVRELDLGSSGRIPCRFVIVPSGRPRIYIVGLVTARGASGPS